MRAQAIWTRLNKNAIIRNNITNKTTRNIPINQLKNQLKNLNKNSNSRRKYKIGSIILKHNDRESWLWSHIIASVMPILFVDKRKH